MDVLWWSSFTGCGVQMPSFTDSTDLLRARFSDVPAWNNEEDPLASVVLRQEFRETSVFDEGTIGQVAVSPRGGVCVARPVEVVAFKDMFLQVTFPPTVVRNEQVEIVATLFNYDKESHDAEIYLNGAPDLCIASKHPRLPHKKRLRVAKNSAGSVSFPVVPLRQGTFPITVSLRGNGRFEDVQKTLTVVPEGTPVEQSFTVIVDPSNEQRRRKRAVVTKAYRGSEAASVGGESIADVESLISMPKGCGEQTMMIMAPALYAYKYLNIKNMLNESGRGDALKYLLEGKHSWSNGDDCVCPALLSRMCGCVTYCASGIHLTIARAQFYIREKLDDIKVPYVAALTAYALSFSPGPDRQKSMETLKSSSARRYRYSPTPTAYIIENPVGRSETAIYSP
ncbi:hypothetical protein HPB51_020943 [Rhipicephalus microplus]|uniref:Alpha-2-macroglobulin domain-containing protein n=1 Tax=Rhipicephalus microplus TaxID=6941 RepID=A0A9J6EC21_RHIMP|nr:hypothetical protein HPB51_020943 [Rhipicephalus microplus]